MNNSPKEENKRVSVCSHYITPTGGCFCTCHRSGAIKDEQACFKCLPNASSPKKEKCVCGSERAILKDKRCINCNLSSIKKEKCDCGLKNNICICDKLSCDFSSPSWEESEREAFFQRFGKRDLDSGMGDCEVGDILEFFIPRLKAVREEGYRDGIKTCDASFETGKLMGKQLALEEAREIAKNMKNAMSVNGWNQVIECFLQTLKDTKS